MEQKQTEQNAVSLLLEKGMEFTIEDKNLFHQKVKRKFTIREPTLGLLDMITSIYLKMEWDPEKLEKDPFGESKVIVNKNARLAAKAIAIMVLGSKMKIRLLAGIYTCYFFWRIKPSKLLQLMLIITQLSNTGDFINSIRLMNGMRTTRTDRIEEKQEV